MSNESEWQAFVRRSADGTFFHDLKWKIVIETYFPNSALYLTFRDENGTLVGICPGFLVDSVGLRRFDSLPFSDYGGPLITERSMRLASLALQGFLSSISDTPVAYAKLCVSNPVLAQNFKLPLSYTNTGKGTVELDLMATPAEFIWNHIFSHKRRKMMKRFERAGYQAQEARTKADLSTFYYLYRENMKHIGGNPYSYEFMEKMWAVLYPANLRIWLVGKERPIGGIAILKDERKSYWILAGLLRGREAITYQVIPYLVWKEIQMAEKESYRIVAYPGLGSRFSHEIGRRTTLNPHEAIVA